MLDVDQLLGMVFSGLAGLVIDEVRDAGEVIRGRARTPGGAVACPGCGAKTARVHGYCVRIVADVPVDGRRLSLTVRVRRMRWGVVECGGGAVRGQLPGPPV